MYAFRGAHAARDAKKKLDLRDEAGERVHRRPARRRRAPRSPSRMLRREVARDLEALMNTIALESTRRSAATSSMSASSILNFGLPDLAHRSIDEIRVDDITDEIEAVLIELRAAPRRGHDPRRRATRRVDAARAQGPLHRAAPTCSASRVNVPVEFVADVELDSGKIAINRL